jgi:hypothetical protein
MKSSVSMFVIFAGVVAAFGQAPPQPAAPVESTQPYEPAVPPPSVNVYGGYGAYGSGGGASTVAGSRMRGMADVIGAKGSYNLSTSAAAINLTHARQQQIQNHAAATSTYFQMRAENKAARAAEAGPRPTEAQLVRIAHEGVPKPLSPSKMDAVSGKLAWPSVLQGNTFATQRRWVESGFAKQAKYGGLSYADKNTLRKLINSMASELKSQIRDVPPGDYEASKDFLQSLMYAGCKCSLG